MIKLTTLHTRCKRNCLRALPALAAALLIIMLSASCSNISEDERFVYVRPANVSRAVLLEDFTGQRCLNCPNANDVIHALQEQYGAENVIGVGIHSGPLGFKGNARYTGLATDDGDEYYKRFGAEYQPVGMINRHGLAPYSSWTAAVSQALEETPALDISLHAAYAPETRQATVGVDLVTLDRDISGHIQVWITEDSVKAFQVMPDNNIDYEYVHNHVFRAAVNGTWGDGITLPAATAKSLTYNYTLPENLVAANCSFVVFVYNDDGVVQAATSKIIPPADNQGEAEE